VGDQPFIGPVPSPDNPEHKQNGNKHLYLHRDSESRLQVASRKNVSPEITSQRDQMLDDDDDDDDNKTVFSY
jgi:hypothetical protein